MIVERIHGDGDHKPMEMELEFGDAATSAEGLGGAIEELRNEVRKLRQEVNQLRAQQRKPIRSQARPAGGNKAEPGKRPAAAAGKVIERVNKQQSVDANEDPETGTFRFEFRNKESKQKNDK